MRYYQNCAKTYLFFCDQKNAKKAIYVYFENQLLCLLLFSQDIYHISISPYLIAQII